MRLRLTGFASAPSTALRAAPVASMNAIGFMEAKLRGLPRAVIGGNHPSSNRGYLRNLQCVRTRRIGDCLNSSCRPASSAVEECGNARI